MARETAGIPRPTLTLSIMLGRHRAQVPHHWLTSLPGLSKRWTDRQTAQDRTGTKATYLGHHQTWLFLLWRETEIGKGDGERGWEERDNGTETPKQKYNERDRE